MKRVSILILLSFLVPSTLLFGQELEELFSSFKAPISWKKTISTDTSFYTFYNEGKIAKISLNNGRKYVNILVFDKAVLSNTEFLEAEEEYETSSSCRNYNANSGFLITSFATLDFYISPELCPNCDFDKHRKCKRLQKSYSAWLRDFIE